MKNTKSTLLLVSLLICSAKFSAQEQLTVPLTNPGKPFTLDVGLLSGSINVTTHPGAEIMIEATAVPVESNAPAEKDGMKRIAKADGYGITISENNNEVRVGNSNFNATVNLIIKVPQQEMKVKLNTVNQGDIEVTNVKGELEINNVSGSIKLSGISGSVVATTISGDLNVKFLSVDPEAAMAFSTLSGDIDLTLPSLTNANLKLKSDMGEMYTDFDLVVDPGNARPVVTQEQGMRKVELNNWVNAKINNGGPEFMMKNMTGNIYIRKAK